MDNCRASLPIDFKSPRPRTRPGGLEADYLSSTETDQGPLSTVAFVTAQFGIGKPRFASTYPGQSVLPGVPLYWATCNCTSEVSSSAARLALDRFKDSRCGLTGGDGSQTPFLVSDGQSRTKTLIRRTDMCQLLWLSRDA